MGKPKNCHEGSKAQEQSALPRSAGRSSGSWLQAKQLANSSLAGPFCSALLKLQKSRLPARNSAARPYQKASGRFKAAHPHADVSRDSSMVFICHRCKLRLTRWWRRCPLWAVDLNSSGHATSSTLLYPSPFSTPVLHTTHTPCSCPYTTMTPTS